MDDLVQEKVAQDAADSPGRDDLLRFFAWTLGDTFTPEELEKMSSENRKWFHDSIVNTCMRMQVVLRR